MLLHEGQCTIDIPVITIEIWFDAQETQTDSEQDQKLCKQNNMHDFKQYLSAEPTDRYLAHRGSNYQIPALRTLGELQPIVQYAQTGLERFQGVYLQYFSYEHIWGSYLINENLCNFVLGLMYSAMF